MGFGRQIILGVFCHDMKKNWGEENSVENKMQLVPVCVSSALQLKSHFFTLKCV